MFGFSQARTTLPLPTLPIAVTIKKPRSNSCSPEGMKRVASGLSGLTLQPRAVCRVGTHMGGAPVFIRAPMHHPVFGCKRERNLPTCFLP